jgi:hypothetical protein
MFDRETLHGSPFHKSEINNLRYRSVAKGAIQGIIAMIPLPKMSFTLVEEFIRFVEAISSDISVEEAGIITILADVMQNEPNSYKFLFDFLKNLFPCKTQYLRLLATMVFDRQSAEQALTIVHNQYTYCVEIPNNYFNDFVTHTSSGWETYKAFKDPFTDMVIPAGSKCNALKQVDQDVSYIKTNVNLSGWKAMFQVLCNIDSLDMYQQSAGEDLLNRLDSIYSFLTVLFRVLNNSDLRTVRFFDKLLEEMKAPLEHYNSATGGGLLHIIFLSLRQFANMKQAMPSQLVAACTKCFIAFAKIHPEATATKLHILVHKYVTKIH